MSLKVYMIMSYDSLFFLLMSSLCFFKSLRRPIYAINSVDSTELPRYTLPPIQHHSFLRNLSPLFNVVIVLLLFNNVALRITNL